MNEPRRPSRVLTALFVPVALAVDAGQLAWRGWGRVALGLDALLGYVMWPFERTADGIAWSLRTIGRVARLATLARWASRTFDRLLRPLEQLLRRAATRLMRIVTRVVWWIADALAPIGRPVGRAARSVGRVLRATYRGTARVLRRLLARVRALVAPARRALRRARERLRRRP